MHEAGHALFSIVYGLPFDRVEIGIAERAPNGTVLGRVVHHAGVSASLSESGWMVSLMCGIAGEKANRKKPKLTVNDLTGSGCGDFTKIAECLVEQHGLTPDSGTYEQVVDFIFESAHRFVVEHRQLHERLTKALLKHGRLTWDECLALDEEHQYKSHDGRTASVPLEHFSGLHE